MIGALQRVLERIRAVFVPMRLDHEFDDEAAAHIQLAVDEYVRRGMRESNARRKALIEFGGMLQSKEQHRNARGLPFVEVALQDLRYAVRTLRRDPGFALVAVLMLGLGIGANAAVFSVVNQLLLRPLPFKNPQHLAWIQQANGKSGLSSQTYSADAFEGFRARSRSFSDVTAYFPFWSPDNYRLSGHGDPVPVTAVPVVGNFFSVLGLEPVIGRLFAPDETVHGGRPAVLLSYAFWQRQFAGDSRVVGQVIDLRGVGNLTIGSASAVTVVGVLPKQFDFGAVFSPGATIDVFVPVLLDDIREWGNALSMIGRLRPGVSIARANEDARSIAPELYFNVKSSSSKGHYTATVTGLKEHVSGQLRRSLIVLWCAVGFTLLIVCVNLANLLIARTGARAKELAMRAALGAERARLIRQLLTESLLLAGAGAVLGLALAFTVTKYLAHQSSVSLPLMSGIRLDGASMLWTLLIALISCAMFGFVPALRMSTGDLQSALKDVGHGMSAGRTHQRLRSSLVVSEIALACMLLVGAGLLLRSFLRVLDVDLGFRPAGVAAIKVEYEDRGPRQRGALLADILQRIQAIPGITSAGVTDNLPLEGNRSWGLRAQGVEYRPGELPGCFVYVITPGYLETMGMRLREGRSFGWGDDSSAAPVVIINETAARYLWPNESAVGRYAMVNGTATRVVGVVSNVHESSLETTGAWQMYLPVMQAGPLAGLLTVRSTLPPALLATSILSTLRSINPTQPATQLRPIQSSVDHAVSPRRFFVLLVAAFAAFGLMLAALGVYGVISYSVAQRTQEIGIRMALGATASQVQAGIIRQTMRLVLIGVTIGAACSLVLSRAIASMLFETAPTDAAALFGTVLLLAFAALAAALVPAHRAARVDPMRALRPT